MNTGITRSEQVYERLKNLISSRASKPGERIPKVKLAAQFGLSRTPIRETIKKLADDGTVTLYPNRFAEINALLQNRLQEAGMVRLSLDTVTTHLTIPYGSNYDYSIMQKLNEECHRAALVGGVTTRIEESCALHPDLSRMSRNGESYEIQKKLYLRLEFAQACNYDNIKSTEGQYRQHCQMIQTSCSRNESMLINILSDHLKKFHSLGGMTPIMESTRRILKAQFSMNIFNIRSAEVPRFQAEWRRRDGQRHITMPHVKQENIGHKPGQSSLIFRSVSIVFVV